MIDHDIDLNCRLLTCRAIGSTPLAEVTATLKAIAGVVRNEAITRSLVLVADMPAFLACSDLRALRPILEAHGDIKHCSRWAVVVPNQSAMVMGEVVFRILNLDKAFFSCFLREEDARAWLEDRKSVGSDIVDTRTARHAGE